MKLMRQKGASAKLASHRDSAKRMGPLQKLPTAFVGRGGTTERYEFSEKPEARIAKFIPTTWGEETQQNDRVFGKAGSERCGACVDDVKTI